jgi:hypothetical protein
VGLTKGQRSEKRKRLTGIYARHVPEGLKATLRTSIVAKLVDLSNGAAPDLCTDGVPVSPEDGPRTFAPTGKANEQPKEGVPSTTPEGPNRTFALHVIKGAKVRAEGCGEGVRRCPVCGRDITHQDPRSRVCSERLYGKVGKACRNTLSNRTLSLQRMAVRSVLLFDERPYIKPPQHLNTSIRQ